MSFTIINKMNGGHMLYVNGFHMPDFTVNKQHMPLIQKWMDTCKVNIYDELDYGGIFPQKEKKTQEETDKEAQDLVEQFMSLMNTEEGK